MSGLEIAGVVLGALPLVISALEHYAKGINTARRFWLYKSQVMKLIDRIETQQTMYINTLEELLVGIAKSDQIATLLADADGALWRKAELDQKLRNRLDRSYDSYFKNVKGMDTALKKIMEKLALDPDGKPQFADPNLFKQEFKRLKFSLNESEYNKQLSDMQHHNQALERLTAQSLKLEPSRAETRSGSCPNYSVLRDYARSVFETLLSGICCACDDHAVKLRLESRTSRIEPEDMLEKTPLRVIFTPTAANTTTSSHAGWREADIKVLLSSQPPISPPVAAITATSTSSRCVRFGPVQNQQCNSNISTVTITQPSPATLQSPTASQIQDLCRAFAAMQLKPSLNYPCAGYLLDKCNRKHGIYLINRPDNSGANRHKWAAYSLREVLTRQTNIGRPLTQLDKFKVAVDLACSVLQLYKTPWLEESWDEGDVYFVHRPGAALNTIYQHPFIYRKLSSTATTQSHIAQTPARRVIRNQTLFTLGVLLIELLYGKPVEELQTKPDLECQGTPGVAWCTAERLIEEELAFEAGPLYSDAVRRCIRCDFNQTSHDLDNREFQQAVFDGVVAPLEKTLRRFKGLE